MLDLDLIAFLALIAAPATNTGSAWVPLVAAIVGGIVAATLASLYKYVQDTRAEEREFKVLM
jgi:hypothetical protein